MSFKYINPGYSNLIQKTNITRVEDIQDPSKSRTGVAFSNTYRDNIIWISPIAFSNAGTEFWLKFDFYWDSSYRRKIYLLLGYPGSSTITCSIDLNSGGAGGEISLGNATVVNNWTLATLQNVTGLRPNAINTAWFHFITGTRSTKDGCIELQLNTKKLYTNSAYAFVIGSTEDFRKVVLYDEYTNAPATSFSSIIISDEEISPNERVVLLPVSNTVTDMDSLQSGLYVADTASETLLQSVDVSALIQDYGSDTNVTAIALIGNPAYQVDDVIGNITALSADNNVVTERETISLSISTDAIISSCFTMPTDTTIADLANMQFGWRAEE